MLSKLIVNTPAKSLYNQKKPFLRTFSVGVPSLQQVVQPLPDKNDFANTDEEWHQAKDFNKMPGPSSIGMISSFFPFGRYRNLNMIGLNKQMRVDYGDIYKIKGILGKPDIVFTYDPKDFALVYRNEGIWPVRIGLESFTYYRKVKRPDIFKGVGGLVSEQGKEWADIRNKVNPIMMKVQTVRRNLEQIDKIACEFLAKIEKSRNPKTNLLNMEFFDELKLWSFESVSYIALNKRLGLIQDNPDPTALRLFTHIGDFFEQSYKYDIVPSIWPYYQTPGFKRFLKTYDSITDITLGYIEDSISRFGREKNREAKSVLEKLCRIDKRIAVAMAMDMLIAGVDTTTSIFTSTLYNLATNPQKQALLRKELNAALPDPKAPVTEENSRNLPYLRACIKETLRITPVVSGNFRMASKDLVLSGYQVPKGTGVLMGLMALSNTDEYFPRAKEYMPERWLKAGEVACPEARNKNPFVYLPFGFGARTCVGKRVAEMEIETMLTRVISNYHVTWQCENELQYKSNIILTPCGNIKFKFEPIGK